MFLLSFSLFFIFFKVSDVLQQITDIDFKWKVDWLSGYRLTCACFFLPLSAEKRDSIGGITLFYNTLGRLIATLVRHSAVKSQVCKRRRPLNEVVVSKWEHDPLSPPPASSIHPCYILKAKDLSASPSPHAANIKTDSSIPDNRCRHLRAQSHSWLQRASIYSCEGWSGRGVTGGKVASRRPDELNSPPGLSSRQVLVAFRGNHCITHGSYVCSFKANSICGWRTVWVK